MITGVKEYDEVAGSLRLSVSVAKTKFMVLGLVSMRQW